MESILDYYIIEIIMLNNILFYIKISNNCYYYLFFLIKMKILNSIEYIIYILNFMLSIELLT